MFILGYSFGEMADLLKRRYRTDAGLDPGPSVSGSMFTLPRVPWRVVWTGKFDLAVVLHETFHLVTRICHDKGVPIVAINGDGHLGDETAAYLFEFFARAVLRRVK